MKFNKSGSKKMIFTKLDLTFCNKCYTISVYLWCLMMYLIFICLLKLPNALTLCILLCFTTFAFFRFPHTYFLQMCINWKWGTFLAVSCTVVFSLTYECFPFFAINFPFHIIDSSFLAVTTVLQSNWKE
jgi:hypothetical protein